MRRFKFRLEAVLKHRLAVEEGKLRAMAAVQAEMAAVEERLAGLREEFDQTVGRRPASIDVADISRRERYVDTLVARITDEERLADIIRSRLDEARKSLVEARQAREAVERIREKDYAE